MGTNRILVLRYAFALGAVAICAIVVDPVLVVRVLGDADVVWVVAALVVGYAMVFLNTAKWRLLIGAQVQPPSFPALLGLNFVAALYGTVLPGQIAGEAVKAVRLARGPRDRAVLVASVLADRITGFLGLLLVGLGGALAGRAPVGVTALLGTTLTAAVATSLALTFVASPTVPVSSGLIRRLARKAQAVFAGMAGFRRARGRLAWSIVLSIVFQLGCTAVITCFAEALGLKVAFVDLAWITAIVSIVQLLPITVASIGTREGAFIVLLAQLGVGRADALALSLLLLVSNLTVAVVGAGMDLFGPSARMRRVTSDRGADAVR